MRSPRTAGHALVSAAALLTAACSGGGETTAPPCTVNSVTVLPAQVTVVAGSSATVSANLATANCTSTPAITWSSSNPGQVSIQGSGAQVQITGVSQTTTPVSVSAAAGTATGTSLVTVVPPPAIGVSSSSLVFSAQAGAPNPASQAVSVTNAGGGTLSGLAVGTISYGAGASGWLIASVDAATAPATLTVQAVTGSLAAGSYSATIPLQSSNAINAPLTITVAFTVTAAPVIAVSATALTFNATQGGGNPSSQAITISNSGGGTLSGLSVGTITYGAGANGWLQAPVLSGTTANPTVTLTVQPVTGALAAGSYTATVPVQSATASNSPRNVTVTFVVAAPAGPPAIGLSPASIAFSAVQGGSNPTSQTVTVSNSGGGTLSGLAVGTITYGAGASGWLTTASLSGTTANPSVSLTLQPQTGSLAPGSYTATVPVTSGVAGNSPQNVSVTFTVNAPGAGPLIALGRSAMTYAATAGGGNPPGPAFSVTNAGSGSLTGLSVGTIGYSAGASGWMQATLASSTANTFLNTQPVITGLAPGSYTATVPVQSAVASNSPLNFNARLIVRSAAADPCDPATAPGISVGEVVTANIGTSSCLLPSGHRADLYALTVGSVTHLETEATATSTFDPFLSLLDASGAVLESDDDDGSGLNSRIRRTLTPGTYVLRVRPFSAGATGSYTLTTVAGTPGSGAFLSVDRGDRQLAAPGSAAPVPPTAIVRDINGFGVAGVTVNFATVTGVGSLSGASAVTGADGVATAGAWTLAAGPNVVMATSPTALQSAFFNATGTTATPSAGLDIHFQFLSMPTPTQLQAFAAAAARWQSIITGDLPNITRSNVEDGACAATAPEMMEIDVDDLFIQVLLRPIDGAGGTLGAASPCLIRTTGSLPVVGEMEFDNADLASLESSGSLNAVILHEMGHVLGIGTLWTTFNLLVNPSLPSSPGVDTRFTGVNGIAGFDLVGGTTYTGGGKVPVENSQGGAGTRDGHWRESVLANELMTGFLNAGSNPLSVLTVRSLQDLGYAVNTAAADPFFVTLSLRAGEETVRLLGDVRRRPIYRIGRGVKPRP